MNLKTKLLLIIVCFFLPFYLFRLRGKLKLAFKEGDRLRIRSQLTSEPQIRGEKLFFRIEGIGVTISATQPLDYGDQLEVSGIVAKKETKAFLPQHYLLQPQVKKISSTQKSIFKSLFQLRKKIEQVFIKTLPEPHSSLISGIVLGSQKTLAKDFYDNLKTSGTLHIIVASGMNISLLAGSLKDFLARFLKRKPAILLSEVVILVYFVICGMTPPISRAAIMASILYLSQLLGRQAEGVWILLITGFVMLIFQPLLLFDTGFQLSFTATLGLFTLSPFFQKKISKIPCGQFFPQETGETLAAIVFTAPILIVTFGNFNPFSLIPNILILWLIPYLMYLGFIIAGLSLLSFSLAQILSYLSWLPLTYLISIINIFGSFKFLELKFSSFSWFLALGYYLLLLSLLANKRNV